MLEYVIVEGSKILETLWFIKTLHERGQHILHVGYFVVNLLHSGLDLFLEIFQIRFQAILRFLMSCQSVFHLGFFPSAWLRWRRR